MITYKLKWIRVRKGKLEQGSAADTFESYQDAYHAIKAIHSYAGEVFELKKIGQKKGFVQFYNTNNQTQFVITWDVLNRKQEPAKTEKKKNNDTEQLFY